MIVDATRYLLFICAFGLVSGIGSLVSAEQSPANPAAEDRKPSAGYEEALFNTQNALRAIDEKDAKKSINFSQLASKATQVAAAYAAKERDAEAERDFNDAGKLLDGAMGFVQKGDNARAAESLFAVLDKLKHKRCQGLGCAKNACGGCLMPGQTGCDSINRNATCHASSPCYCPCY